MLCMGWRGQYLQQHRARARFDLLPTLQGAFATTTGNVPLARIKVSTTWSTLCIILLLFEKQQLSSSNFIEPTKYRVSKLHMRETHEVLSSPP